MLQSLACRRVLASLRVPAAPTGARWMASSPDLPPAEEVPKKRPLLKRLWEGPLKKDDDKLAGALTQQEQEYQQDVARYEAFLRQERREEVARKKNKSKLRYSDRMRLMGKPPLEGLQLESEDFHRSQEYKSYMFGLYGSESGLSPRVCWPTRETMEEQREWERVFYDGVVDIKERMEQDRQKKIAKEEHVRQREEEIEQKLLKMDQEIKQWKTRIDMRNQVALREKERRERILADLREEYGYDMDPNNPHYAEKIAEKEKEYLKREKEEKKKRRAEMAQKRKEEEEALKTQEAAK